VGREISIVESYNPQEPCDTNPARGKLPYENLANGQGETHVTLETINSYLVSIADPLVPPGFRDDETDTVTLRGGLAGPERGI
jgi:hypothetical protein